MRQPALLEAITHREPGLTAADDECLDPLNRHRQKIDEIRCRYQR
jgi:hypothetical protein